MGYNPWLRTPTPCWTCHYYAGLTAFGTAAFCTLPNGSKVVALPEHGCAFWEREPGADDEVRRPDAPAPSDTSPPTGRSTPS